ncbi:RNA 2'-phosphotransferase [Methanolapillus millepedarum]|uniref:Probable RNA 2'-phosphotransferase n=1 Tax=Methanolapillus millepedarum TaxID=3028296 RepID=A0AA96V4Q2_9EURY|nr:putative RNA 2'-phosphotransferase [Methanosarcinaceae archaeon Ac7]
MIRKCKEHGCFRGEACPYCGAVGDFILDDDREDRLGRFVSGALRHFPEKLELPMYIDGWVSINALTAAAAGKYKWPKKYHIYALVESDEKGRYEIAGGKIRARYGHSIGVILNYPAYEGEFAYYGVSPEEVDVILEQGIHPVKQKYLHLSTTLEKAIEVAMIHTENPSIFKIDAKAACEDGLNVMVANDDILLTDEIPVDYILEIYE